MSASRGETATGDVRGRGVRVHRFAVLSGIGWLLDFTVFNLLAWSGIGLFAANMLGATTGVTWVFVTARLSIFQRRTVSLRRAILAYAIWNAVAIVAASAAVDALGSLSIRMLSGHVHDQSGSRIMALVPAIAKMAVTPFTMYLNFVAMAFIVERRWVWR